MEDDPYVDAACPATDLTARLLAELRRAEGELARNDELFAAAADVAVQASGHPRFWRTRREWLTSARNLRATLLNACCA
jgi:hypothetical protein